MRQVVLLGGTVNKKDNLLYQPCTVSNKTTLCTPIPTVNNNKKPYFPGHTVNEKKNNLVYQPCTVNEKKNNLVYQPRTVNKKNNLAQLIRKTTSHS